MRRRNSALLLQLFLLLLAGCGATRAAPTAAPTRPIATLFPTAAADAQGTAPPAATPIPDTGWQPGRLGVELRRVQASAPGRSAIPLTIVRLDPTRVRLRVAYAPDQPRGLRSWFEERRPLAAINGGFFTPAFQATALLISDGVASGASYDGFGGMLAIAPDGGVSLRALRDQPYDPGEALDQALQSFPMLVFPGGEPAALEDDRRRARRSVVALDRDGRVLLLASPTSDFTLRGLADWLSRSDLAVDRALNLDGGSSTGLYLSDGALQEAIDSFGPLPIVLLVEPK
ncbi:MAG TPA: phosphodiester glycosidase family protein [Roseiflexaceae bacterium]|nr:phosphodiester glycosidase family protein [Roseiflexaceae bacterium]